MCITDAQIIAAAKAIFRQMFSGIEWVENVEGQALCILAAHRALGAAFPDAAGLKYAEA